MSGKSSTEDDFDVKEYLKVLSDLDSQFKKIVEDLGKRKKTLKQNEVSVIMNQVATIDKRVNLNIKVIERCLPSKIAFTNPDGDKSYRMLDVSKLTDEELKAVKGALNAELDE